MTDPAAWRCPVCEGVNHGSRVCATCGERLPDGFVPADAVRRPTPAPAAPAAPTVVAPPRPPRPTTFEDVFGSSPMR